MARWYFTPLTYRILDTLITRNVHISRKGEKLAFAAPAGALDLPLGYPDDMSGPTLRSLLYVDKPALLAWVDDMERRKRRVHEGGAQ